MTVALDAAAPVGPAQAAVPAPGVCFAAGGASVCLPAVPAGCAVEAALALPSAEPLLAALDAWCEAAGVALPDWAWCGAAPAPAGACAQALWRGHALAAELRLPWPLLRRLGPPPAALAAALHWQPLAARLWLAELDLGPEDQAALEPGALLLLAPSFAAPWRGRLRAEDETAEAGVVMDLADPDAPRPVPALPAPGSAAAWRVGAALEAVPVAALCGWPEGQGAIRLPPALWLWHGDALRAAGRLVPWGRGAGLRIERLLAEGRWT